ncbi:hypothetical protein [Luteimicrobium subarcticum]|uniref:Uncharacterized protein n=1 Tax=Luteimicrobium subarcticum TaxID=620910 RepID=A0A2M8WS63_9MICO|nr:hypothetical protein [Luteimicrobium subarcticum]PJI93787.1 hypothetical protein CLV34_1262 [Luteimicrobium subarcticum]
MSTPTGTPRDTVTGGSAPQSPASSGDGVTGLDDLGRHPLPPLRRSQKVGLWILVVITVLSMVPFTTPGDTDDAGNQVGPPVAILVVDGLLAIGILVAIVVAFRTRSRLAIRIACGLAILDAVTALPAFFADQPAGIVVAAAVYVIATAVAVVLALRVPRSAELLPAS